MLIACCYFWSLSFSSILHSPQSRTGLLLYCLSPMLSSLPSSWLDRLRSSKGFPSVDSPSLDHFLAHPHLLPPFLPHAHSHSRLSPPDPPPTPLPTILSDLFCVAPSSPSLRLPRPKFPRKQPNPKSFSLPLPLPLTTPPASLPTNTFCPRSPIRVLIDDPVPSSNSDNTSKAVDFQATPDVGWGGDVDEEEEGGDQELTGYSRSEVTVIDTSCDIWKSDRVVFRRRNVWKVRAKKGKLRSYGRKKRKHDHIQGIPVAASGNNDADALGFQDLSCSNPEDASGNRLKNPSCLVR